jgi:uncharacterized membrane protein (DUF485 family)
MPHFDHRPVARETVNPGDVARNSRYGLALFAVYGVLYAAFMLITALAPRVLEMTVVAGINLAVVYGLTLIFAAFLLALIYLWLCRSSADAGGRP